MNQQRGLFSIRLELAKVLQSDKYEQLVFENLERCKRMIGPKFNVIFWCKTVDKIVVNDFAVRNRDKLFYLGVELTRNRGSVWFLIKSSPEEKSTARYMYDGDVLEGIVQYLEIVNHMKKRDNI